MRSISMIALIGVISGLVTLVATDYGSARKNLDFLLDRAFFWLGPYAHYTLATFLFLILVISIRALPRSLKQGLLGVNIGRAEVFRNRDEGDYQRFFTAYAKRASCIDVIGIGNSQFSEKDWLRTIDNAVGRNRARVRVLFLDPEGDWIKWREYEEKHDAGWLSNQVRAHVRFFQEMAERVDREFPNSAGLMSYRYYNEYPSCNLILFDSQSAFIQPYFFSLRGRANPIILLNECHQQETTVLVNEFNRLWDSSRIP